MVDRNLQNFYGRLGRIDSIHQAGGGFEAEGTLGMSFYNARRRRQTRRVGILGPLAVVAMSVVALKSTVHATIGADLYEKRVVALGEGTAVEKAGAYVLQADPLTLAISGKIRDILN